MGNSPAWVLAAAVAAVSAAAGADTASAGEKKEWPVSAKIEGELKTNEWVKVEEHGAARRYGGALFYLPGEKSFVLAMGAVGAWNDHGPFCYDEQTFDLAGRIWKNRFPDGKGWKPEIGPCDAPKLPNHGYRLKDGRIGLWEGGFVAYFQYAFDPDRGRLVAYVHNRLIEYDPASRSWKELAPGAPSGQEHKLWWGSLCYDAHNREYVLFGGNNGPSEFNDTRTWAFSVEKNEWKRVAEPGGRIEEMRIKARGLRLEAEALHAALLNRYFRTETPAAARANLAGRAKNLLVGIDALRAELSAAGASGTGKARSDGAAAELGAAAEAAAKLGEAADPASIGTALAISRTLWRAETELMSEPPPRAHSQMAYDPASKKIVLFGGDRLDMLYSDTWVYDCASRTWEKRRPPISPSPRAGHALIHLPKSGRIVLLGGYKFKSDTGYWGPLYEQLPMQAWTYDAAADRWTLIGNWGKPEPCFMESKGCGFVAASDGEDTIVAFGSERRKDMSTTVTFACRLDPAAAAPEAEAETAGARGEVAEWRTGPYDPAWYVEGAPTPDEEAFQNRLKGIPPNTWTMLTGKGDRLPRQNRDWGTAVYDPDRQAIYRWSGGHSAHCGSDIPVFSMRTGRYHIKYPPAFPLEGIGSCGSQPSRMTFMGQPWISAHTYHSYAYDRVSRKMVCCGHESYSFVYDPDTGLWAHKPQPKGMREDNFYTLTLCPAPAGPFAWTRFGTLFKYDGAKDEWSPVALGGEKLPGTSCDASGMCCDTRRDRLILTHANLKCGLLAVDIKTGAVSKLDPAGADLLKPETFFWREAVYDESNDAVVVAIRVKGDSLWPVYDCAKNAWVEVKISGSPGFGCSDGFMYDPDRRLVLAVDTNSNVYALRLDLAAAAGRN